MSSVRERYAWRMSGFLMVVIEAAIFSIGVLTLHDKRIWDILEIAVFLLIARGFLVVQPNESKVLTLFGQYSGSISASGWHWTNPFTVRRTVSRRIRNFTSERLKVNDANGNPVEIAAVVVWHVVDSALAVFDVEDFVSFVSIQSETALRALAGTHPYDAGRDKVTLLGNQDLISADLAKNLQERLTIAGVEVLDARLAHLAYAPEIAQVMLRRQQAEAIVAARQTIVDGALGMVHRALDNVLHSGLVDLDEERKAAMVNNLLVVLASDQAVHPIINAGTLYS